MMRGIELVDLAKRITESRSLKADYLAPASALEMAVQDDGKIGLKAFDGPDIPGVRPIAHGQIGSYLAIPKPYYDRMLQHDPRLLANNVNRWFRDSNDKRMLRTMAGDLRGFLSDRYQRIENEEVAEQVLPVLFEAGVTVKSCEVTERRLYITAVNPRVRSDVKVGDVVEAGVTISNSEVGFGAVSVRPFANRLFCDNGMVLPDGKFSAKHVGRRLSEDEDLNAIFADDTRQADDRALLLKCRDTVRAALDEARFSRQVDKMRALAEGRVTGDPSKCVELLAQKAGITESEKGGLLGKLIEGGDLSAWGLTNAVTALAHNAADYDRSMELCEAGGKLLDLPKGEWKQILEAA